MNFPYSLLNGAGNYVDHNKYMANLHWLFAMNRGSILGNGGMEQWSNGVSFTNPANAAELSSFWTLEKGGTTGSVADVAREATEIDTGTYSMKVDMQTAGSSNSYLRIAQTFSNPERFNGLTVAFGVDVKCATASKVRLSITDGTSTAYSSYHTGGGTFEKLTIQLVCAASVSALTVKVEIISDFDTDAVYIDSAFLYETATGISAVSVAALEYMPPRPGADFFVASDGQIYGWNGTEYVIVG